MSFDPQFVRDIMLPLVAAAYQIFENPGATPVLPPGNHQTALLEADLGVLTATADLSQSARSFAETAPDAGTVFGLIGHNLEPAVKTAFVAFRGTRTDAEWLHNLDIITTAYRPVPNFGEVHMGWMALYETIRASPTSNLAAACAGCDQLVVTGHSPGAALAELAAPDIDTNVPPKLEPKLTTFGGPRAGLHDFVVAFNTTIDSCFRVVNRFDIVPHLPLPFTGLPYEHVGVQIAVDSGGPSTRPTGTTWLPTAAAWTTSSPTKPPPHSHTASKGRSAVSRGRSSGRSVVGCESYARWHAASFQCSQSRPSRNPHHRSDQLEPHLNPGRLAARQPKGANPCAGFCESDELQGVTARRSRTSPSPRRTRARTRRTRSVAQRDTGRRTYSSV
jgi:hypothetical protein